MGIGDWTSEPCVYRTSAWLAPSVVRRWYRGHRGKESWGAMMMTVSCLLGRGRGSPVLCSPAAALPVPKQSPLHLLVVTPRTWGLCACACIVCAVKSGEGVNTSFFASGQHGGCPTDFLTNLRSNLLLNKPGESTMSIALEFIMVFIELSSPTMLYRGNYWSQNAITSHSLAHVRDETRCGGGKGGTKTSRQAWTEMKK